MGRFEELSAEDVLFIDSSHVAKTGSDVNYLHLEVLPRLKPGVVVTFPSFRIGRSTLVSSSR